jgi:hypothetical protein
MGTAAGPDFPGMTPMGGTLMGTPVLVSDGCLAGDFILVDASGIGGAAGEMVLQQMREATLQLDAAPDSPPTAATTLVSLWQENLAGILCERYFVATKLRTDSVGYITGAAYAPS